MNIPGTIGTAENNLDGARQMVFDGVASVVPYARERGIEPLHPMYCADRNVIVTLGQANNFAERLNRQFAGAPVGVVIDVFHVWWDPLVY